MKTMSPLNPGFMNLYFEYNIKIHINSISDNGTTVVDIGFLLSWDVCSFEKERDSLWYWKSTQTPKFYFVTYYGCFVFVNHLALIAWNFINSRFHEVSLHFPSHAKLITYTLHPWAYQLRPTMDKSRWMSCMLLSQLVIHSLLAYYVIQIPQQVGEKEKKNVCLRLTYLIPDPHIASRHPLSSHPLCNPHHTRIGHREENSLFKIHLP